MAVVDAPDGGAALDAPVVTISANGLSPAALCRRAAPRQSGEQQKRASTNRGLPRSALALFLVASPCPVAAEDVPRQRGSDPHSSHQVKLVLRHGFSFFGAGGGSTRPPHAPHVITPLGFAPTPGGCSHRHGRSCGNLTARTAARGARTPASTATADTTTSCRRHHVPPIGTPTAHRQQPRVRIVEGFHAIAHP